MLIKSSPLLGDCRMGANIIIMREEYKIKSALFRTLCALIICLALILVKFVFKNDIFLEEVYNYLTTDIVFLK